MVANTNKGLRIVKEELGEYTGDRILYTEDGRVWEQWNGFDKTGEEVRTEISGLLIP